MEYDFENTEESTSNFPTRLDPGILEVEVSGIKDVIPDDPNKSPYVQWSFVNDEGEHEERLYTSEAAVKHTMSKMKHLSLQMISNEDLNAVKNTSGLERALQGKKVRIKLSGEEVQGQNGAFIKARLGWPPCAENVGVDIKDSKLKFSESKDVKMLTNKPSTAPLENQTSEAKDDLPF